MRFERLTGRRRGPGLTPLIDVVFLLLVFFMLASRFEVESALPLHVSGSMSTSATDRALRIEIDEAGQASIDGRPASPARVLAEAMEAERDRRGVRVRPDAETPLQPIVDVLGALKRAGVSDAGLERE